MNFKNTYLIPILFVITSCGGSFDPEDCNPSEPKQPKVDGDRYSISSKGYPLKNGKEYANSPGFIAGEIYNIVLAQDGSLDAALNDCRRAMSQIVTDASQYGRDAVITANQNLAGNNQKCFTLYNNYRNSSVLAGMRSNKTYQRKIVKKADGYYESCHVNGAVEERYTILDGKKDGLYERYYSVSNGAQLARRENYVNGKLDGEAISFYKNGALEEQSNYKDGNREGLYVAYHENGQLERKQNYINGQRNGPFERYTKDGLLLEKADFQDGKYKGIYESYYTNGKLKRKSSASYLNKGDIKDGKSEKYFEDGQLEALESYTEGIKDGDFQFYAKDGRALSKASYKKGLKDGVFENYYENGNLKYKIKYSNDVLDGVHEEYTKDGLPYFKRNYKSGKKDGVNEEYYDGGSRGKIKAKFSFKDGLLSGEYEEYGLIGEVTESGIYENNQKTSFTKYGYHNGVLNSKTAFIRNANYDPSNESRQDAECNRWTNQAYHKHGDHEYYIKNKDGSVYLASKQSYKDDRLEIELKNGSDNGTTYLISQKSYKNCKKDGLWIQNKLFKDDGKSEIKSIEKVSYKDGLENGPYEKLDTTYGVLKERGAYINGNLDGVIEAYSYNPYTKENFLETKKTYTNGINDGVFEKYYSWTRQLMMRIVYKNGKLNGLTEEYDDQGFPLLKATYKDGILEGPYTKYFPNSQGAIEINANFENGNSVPPYERFNSNGFIIESSMLSEGTIIAKSFKYDLKGEIKNKEVCSNNICIYEQYYDNGVLEVKGQRTEEKGKQVLERYNRQGSIMLKVIYNDDREVHKREQYQYSYRDPSLLISKTTRIPSENKSITEKYCKDGGIEEINELLHVPGKAAELTVVQDGSCRD